MEEANLAVAAFLTGLIWTIQVVHYPLFDRVGQEAWRTYEAAHQRAITPLVLPVMLANLGIAAALLLDEATGLTVANAALAGTIFAATGLYYGPLHGRLAQGWDPVLHRRLVVLNWLRTAAWSAQTAVALALL